MKPINMYKILVFINLRQVIYVKLSFPKEQFADKNYHLKGYRTLYQKGSIKPWGMFRLKGITLVCTAV